MLFGRSVELNLTRQVSGDTYLWVGVVRRSISVVVVVYGSEMQMLEDAWDIWAILRQQLCHALVLANQKLLAVSQDTGHFPDGVAIAKCKLMSDASKQPIVHMGCWFSVIWAGMYEGATCLGLNVGKRDHEASGIDNLAW